MFPIAKGEKESGGMEIKSLSFGITVQEEKRWQKHQAIGKTEV